MMVDNRYATALVIGSVLSLLATVYLSVAVGTPYWYQYSSPQNNSGEMPSHDVDSEKTFMEKLYQSSGTLGLWWYCIQGPGSTGSCRSYTLQQQLSSKYTNPVSAPSEEDLLRTYLWRCQFVLPLVSLGLVSLAALIGLCSCLCRSLTPTLFVGVLHLLAGLCSLAATCCFLVGLRLLHRLLVVPEEVEGSLGWSLYLALASSPLHMMAGALLMWASGSHRKNYRRMTAYRVA
ncbi:claudin domain-containing protein 1-like [Brienomyrus brachyistius]|uniref:claudin domain-containing protein 1-like n=1 Tax=Brienomyrus brachyistius TaxID=42636 RepID=UPI0020B25317|nr:claudin domain-containing protein 1-like [Brienomyrus brachyistius]